MTGEDSAAPTWTPELIGRLEILAGSFRRLSGRSLVSSERGVAQALWDHPAAIVAHGLEADPVFFFGNRTAVSLFELDFKDFARLPSRLSAEPLLREERERLLARVSADGIIDDYNGVRISASGRRFRIEQATVWNLIDAAGALHGQAAMFERWTPV